MSIAGLNHLSLRIAPEALDETLAFYETSLGLVAGDRPPFQFPGAWLYPEGAAQALIHIIATGEESGPAATGRVDHIAFSVVDAAGTEARLKQAGVDYQVRKVPGGGPTQFFLNDPNGVRLELTVLS